MSKFTDLLADFASEKHFLAVLEPFDPVAGAVRPIYLSSHGFVSAPGDMPANTYFDGRLRSAFNFTRALFQQGKLSGRSIPGEGSIEIVNEDGALDDFAGLAWGGRRIRVWLGGVGFALAEYGLIFEGTAQGLAWNDGAVTVNLRDLQYVFDREFQPAVFAGTGGVEGGDALKDKRKPRAYGVCRAVSPIYLGPDTGKHLFALSDGPIVGVYRVLDRGVPLTQATAGSALSPGEWHVDLATGVLALGGAFDGPISVDIIGARYLNAVNSGGATPVTIGIGSKTFGVVTTAGFVVGQRVRVEWVNLFFAPQDYWMEGVITSMTATSMTVLVDLTRGSADLDVWRISPLGTVAGIAHAVAGSLGITAVDALSIEALDLWQPATVGIWRPEGGNGGELLDALMDGAGCYWGFDRTGAFEVGRLDEPGTPTLTLDETQIHSIEREPTEEPTHEFSIGYARAWSALSADQIAGAVSDADRAFLVEPWRYAKRDDPAVLAAWLLSKPVTIESVFDRQSDADDEALRQVALFGVARSYLRVRLKTQPMALEIGDTVAIRHARYGLAAAKPMRIVDLTEDMDAYEVTMGLWG